MQKLFSQVQFELVILQGRYKTISGKAKYRRAHESRPFYWRKQTLGNA